MNELQQIKHDMGEELTYVLGIAEVHLNDQTQIGNDEIIVPRADLELIRKAALKLRELMQKIPTGG